jgi:hypothetical protein
MPTALTSTTIEPASPALPASPAAERRRTHRQKYEIDGLIFDERSLDAPGQPVRVFDMSLAGVGFRSTLPLPLYSTFLIEITSPTIHLNCRVRITRCDRRTIGHDVGAEFIER